MRWNVSPLCDNLLAKWKILFRISSQGVSIFRNKRGFPTLAFFSSCSLEGFGESLSSLFSHHQPSSTIMESKKEHKIVNEDYNNVADVVQLNQSVFTYVPGGEAEKKLQRKIDMRLIPTVWLMYFLSYLGESYPWVERACLELSLEGLHWVGLVLHSTSDVWPKTTSILVVDRGTIGNAREGGMERDLSESWHEKKYRGCDSLLTHGWRTSLGSCSLLLSFLLLSSLLLSSIPLFSLLHLSLIRSYGSTILDHPSHLLRQLRALRASFQRYPRQS